MKTGVHFLILSFISWLCVHPVASGDAILPSELVATIVLGIVAPSPGWVETRDSAAVTPNAPDESNVPKTQDDSVPFRQLVRKLNAYANAVIHQTFANSDSETADLHLENASIRLSSRMLSAMSQAACHPRNPGTLEAAAGKCPLDDESVHLRDLTDMLSYAASRLQQLAASAESPDATETLEMARVRSLEHLYRMTFAISKAHFDPSQSGVYFEAAREQLTLAHNSIEVENNLCSCNSAGYNGRLRELLEVDRLLWQFQADDARQ